jgi:hypothetical protein
MKFDVLRTTNNRTADWLDTAGDRIINRWRAIDRLRCSIPLRKRTRPFWLPEVCIKTDGRSDEIDVGLDVNRNAVFVTSNVSLLRVRVLKDLLTINIIHGFGII